MPEVNRLSKIIFTLTFMLLAAPAFAVDSYRYTHVTIETPWLIFLFLLVIILLPFILSAILYWYFATKKDEKASDQE
jgi:hypothetical protein